MTEGTQKTGENLTAAEREVLLRVNDLDCSPRGCFARRETLARMLNCSVSRVEHALADLKRRGFVTVTTRGRRRDEAAAIRVTASGRKAAAYLQKVYKQSRSVSKDEYLAPKITTSSQREPVPTAPEPEPFHEPPVVTKQPIHQPEEPNTVNPEAVEVLVGAGVAPGAARSLARQHGPRRIQAAVRYVQQSRSEILNAGGMVRAALEGRWRLPSWCWPDTSPDARKRPCERRSPGAAPGH